MDEPGRLFDLPDEPRRRVRGPLAAAVVALVLLAAGVVVARTFALAGTARPWLSVQLVLAVPAMVGTWLAAGPHRHRTWIVVGAMVAALALQPVTASGITPSPSRVAQIVDALGLPGRTVRESSVGNARCRPACSELRRVSSVTGISYAKARANVEGLLRAHGFKVHVYPHSAGAPERIDAQNDEFLVQFELRSVSQTTTRIASVWLARGPRSDFEVG